MRRKMPSRFACAGTWKSPERRRREMGWLPMSRRRSVALNETNKLRSVRNVSAYAATALGLAWMTGLPCTEPFGGSLAYGQLMAPPASSPPVAIPSNQAPTVPSTGSISSNPTAPSTVTRPATSPVNPLRDQAVNLTAQAKLALGRGDVANAKTLIEKANSLRVPESDFGSGQTRPWQVAMEIDRAERQRSSGPQAAPPTLPATGSFQPLPSIAPSAVITASATMPIQANAASQSSAVGKSVYDPRNDTTQVRPASTFEVTSGSSQLPSNGDDLFRSGIAALSAGDRDQAVKLFNEAWKYEREDGSADAGATERQTDVAPSQQGLEQAEHRRAGDGHAATDGRTELDPPKDVARSHDRDR